jgi:hypothetical protein
MSILKLIDETSVENNPQNRKLCTFSPRLWRVNEELARKIFKYECESKSVCSETATHHPFCKANWEIPYGAGVYLRWFTATDLEKMNKWYWEYIEHCESIRGEVVTKCRSRESIDYVPPFPIELFEIFKSNINDRLGR